MCISNATLHCNDSCITDLGKGRHGHPPVQSLWRAKRLHIVCAINPLRAPPRSPRQRPAGQVHRKWGSDNFTLGRNYDFHGYMIFSSPIRDPRMGDIVPEVKRSGRAGGGHTPPHKCLTLPNCSQVQCTATARGNVYSRDIPFWLMGKQLSLQIQNDL